MKSKPVIMNSIFPEWDNKEWVVLKFTINGQSIEWVPSMKELADIFRRIGILEDNKYPSGEGRRMFANFLYEAICKTNIDIENLANKYQIPERYLLVGREHKQLKF